MPPGRRACRPRKWPATWPPTQMRRCWPLGHTAEAAALIDPLTTPPADRANWNIQAARAEIDLLRRNTGAAAERRWRQIYAAFPVVIIRGGFAFEIAPRAVEASLWAGRPGDALQEVRRALALFKGADLTIFAGRLLAARSEEHTSELQSRPHLVCRLL